MAEYAYPESFSIPDLVISDDQWHDLENTTGISLSLEARESIKICIFDYISRCAAHLTAARTAEIKPLLMEINKFSLKLRSLLSEMIEIDVTTLENIKIDERLNGTHEGFIKFFENIQKYSSKDRKYPYRISSATRNLIDNNLKKNSNIDISVYDIYLSVCLLKEITAYSIDSIANIDTGSPGDFGLEYLLKSSSDIFLNSGGVGINTEQSKKFLVQIRDLAAIQLDTLSKENPGETAYSDLAQRIRYNDGTGLVEKMKRSRRKKGGRQEFRVGASG